MEAILGIVFKTFPECGKNNSVPATPLHMLTGQDGPLLVYPLTNLSVASQKKSNQQKKVDPDQTPHSRYAEKVFFHLL